MPGGDEDAAHVVRELGLEEAAVDGPATAAGSGESAVSEGAKFRTWWEPE